MSNNDHQNKSEKPIPTFRKNSMPALFVELAEPDDLGFSRVVSVREFVGKYQKLIFGNGGSWTRKDGSLAKHYNVKVYYEGRSISHVELQGYAEKSKQKPIPNSIRKAITAKRCVVLATSKPECDHKDGRVDDPRFSDIRQVIMGDFQPLSKAANDAKRQHCINCRNTGLRFDAKRLGYQVSQVIGGEKYIDTCVGCYWHDPFFFNEDISRNYSD